MNLHLFCRVQEDPTEDAMADVKTFNPVPDKPDSLTYECPCPQVSLRDYSLEGFERQLSPLFVSLKYCSN
jgi:hypothetical protein